MTTTNPSVVPAENVGLPQTEASTFETEVENFLRFTGAEPLKYGNPILTKKYR